MNIFFGKKWQAKAGLKMADPMPIERFPVNENVY